MKCPSCDGRGAVQIAPNVKGLKRCPVCGGSGEVPQTNEEWLRSATTEQLAEWIAKQKCDGCKDEPYDDKHGTCKYCMEKKTEQIREWLKQPHKE